jgi:hypothetical protein
LFEYGDFKIQSGTHNTLVSAKHSDHANVTLVDSEHSTENNEQKNKYPPIAADKVYYRAGFGLQKEKHKIKFGCGLKV